MFAPCQIHAHARTKVITLIPQTASETYDTTRSRKGFPHYYLRLKINMIMSWFLYSVTKCTLPLFLYVLGLYQEIAPHIWCSRDPLGIHTDGGLICSLCTSLGQKLRCMMSLYYVTSEAATCIQHSSLFPEVIDRFRCPFWS